MILGGALVVALTLSGVYLSPTLSVGLGILAGVLGSVAGEVVAGRRGVE